MYICLYMHVCVCVGMRACVWLCEHACVCACVCDLFISVCGKDTHSYRFALVALWKSS